MDARMSHLIDSGRMLFEEFTSIVVVDELLFEKTLAAKSQAIIIGN